MKYILSLTIGLLVVGGFEARAQPTFSLYCRGEFHYVVRGGGGLQISLDKADRAAGNNGVDLVARTCAWRDRPISAGEPGKLIYLGTDTARTALMLCSQSPNCTFQVRAFNDSTGRFQVRDPIVWIWNR